MYKSGTKWTNIVTDAERRKCDCSATNDATIYKFVLQVKQELDELGLLNTESLDLNSTKWKVCAMVLASLTFNILSCFRICRCCT
jgi:hypothetical protein